MAGDKYRETSGMTALSPAEMRAAARAAAERYELARLLAVLCLLGMMAKRVEVIVRSLNVKIQSISTSV